jgi:hypothetical protein
VELPPDGHVSPEVTQTLFIFCCTREHCAVSTDSWRAFKHIYPQPGKFTEGAQGRAFLEPVHHAALSASAGAATEPKLQMQHDWSAAPKTDTWGLSSNDWGSCPENPGDADFMELNSALDELSMQPPPSLQV